MFSGKEKKLFNKIVQQLNKNVAKNTTKIDSKKSNISYKKLKFILY
jgi:hypothetical protein